MRPRDRNEERALGEWMADRYTRSPGAAAVAAIAVRLGLGEVRLAATTPYLAYVVDAPAGPALDALAAYASCVMEASVHVLSLEMTPEWRRAQLWAAAPSLGSVDSIRQPPPDPANP